MALTTWILPAVAALETRPLVPLADKRVIFLSITGQSCPAGRVYIVVDNDGTDPIEGTFNGIPEGGLIAVGTQVFQISYVGGTGNDLTATALGAVPVMDHLGLVILALTLAAIAAVILR